MNITPGYMNYAVSARARVRVAVSETPKTCFCTTTIDGQRPKAPPS